jgi:hypothetical protein
LVSPEDDLAPSEGKGLRSPSGREENKTGRRKERKKGENRLSLNIDILGLPMQFRKMVYR